MESPPPAVFHNKYKQNTAGLSANFKDEGEDDDADKTFHYQGALERSLRGCLRGHRCLLRLPQELHLPIEDCHP